MNIKHFTAITLLPFCSYRHTEVSRLSYSSVIALSLQLHSSYTRWILSLAILLVASVAQSAVIDRNWCRYQSSGFELVTDLGEVRAHELIHDLELFRSSTSKMMNTTSVVSRPVKTVVFSRQKDFHKVFDMKPFVGFMRPSLVANLLILGPGPEGDYLNATAFHEYTHHLLRSRGLASYPSWYEEGFATYLASLEFSEHELTLGADNIYRVQSRPKRALAHSAKHLGRSSKDRPFKGLSIRKIFELKNPINLPRHQIGSFYEKSWLLVHMFNLGHLSGLPDRRQALTTYLEKLNSGFPQKEAFDLAFGVSYRSLEKNLKRYASRKQLPSIKLPVAEALHYKIQKLGCMDRSEIAYELGIASAYQNPPYAHSLFSEAIASNGLDSDLHVGLSLVSRYQGNIDDARSHAQSAVEMDFKNVFAKVQLANVLLDSCRRSPDETCGKTWAEATTLYRQAMRQEPSRIDAVFGLGVTYLYTGQPGEAVNYLRVAHRRAPWAPRINLYLGESYRLIGDEKKARTHLTNALRWEPRDVWRKRAQDALDMLELKPSADR